MHHYLRSLSLLLLLSGSLTARPTGAPDAAETKIRLLSEALHARDAGDMTVARKNLQELLVLAPNDETVKRLLASLERPIPRKVSTTGGTEVAEADQLLRTEEERLARLIEAAGAAAKQGRALARQGRVSEALEILERTRAGLPENNLTKEALAGLARAKAEISTAAARQQAVIAAPGKPPKPAGEPDPAVPRPDEASALAARGRSQYLAGEAALAERTFHQLKALEPDNVVAAHFLGRIADERAAEGAARAKTSARMLGEVDAAWQRPAGFPERVLTTAGGGGTSPLREKIERIVLPSVNFSDMELSRVVNTLSVISEEFDESGSAPRGVNIVLLDQGKGDPAVNLTLRNLPLKRVLDFITDSVGYQYEVQADAIVVRPAGDQTSLETQFFPITRPTVLRMTGKGYPAGAGSSAESPKGGPATPGGLSVDTEGQAIRGFLELAGVVFTEVKGSTLAFDGSQLIVTQTPRNLERIRNILNRYNGIRQVEIEAKFMEVQQGALDELGVQWNVAKKATQHSGATVSDYLTSNRSLAGAFTGNAAGTAGGINRADSTTTDADGNVVTLAGTGVNQPISNNPPPIPGTNNLGLTANPLAAVTGILGEFNVNAVVRALSQKSGTELLSAPKLTVLSGNTATITVAQELRYPQSFGQVQSQVGTGSASGGGSAGVAITAGTPQEFTSRNVGVELKVTPTVEEDDYSISLDLNPKVTEFEGFVEYGGQSIAISGGTTVTVPSGFFQPIFGVREMSTRVTVWDGATLVMGGLTREDVKKVSDKVPVLGNLPGIGRLFRSRGESTQKRNLLIFVTASLVNPGGALKRQLATGAGASSLYENPAVVTPAGFAASDK